MLPSQDQQISLILLGRLRRVVSSEVKSRSGRWAMWIAVRSLLAISTISLFDTFWIYHHLPSLTPPVPTSVTGTRLTTYSLLRCLLALLFCSRAVEDRIANVRIVDVDLQRWDQHITQLGKWEEHVDQIEKNQQKLVQSACWNWHIVELLWPWCQMPVVWHPSSLVLWSQKAAPRWNCKRCHTLHAQASLILEQM